LTEQEKAIIEARLEEYENNPEVGCSWEEAKAAQAVIRMRLPSRGRQLTRLD
jgi:hypothetical protein